ncbi:MAG: peptide chain release factor 1 [Clostridiales Family XIII bacterium]|jgi:peptide chain release factor 1|nr:peptide chain release factor 1 [Clostridiales Family XIII bacterium]
MYDKLDFIQEKYNELSVKVSDPGIIGDRSAWQRYMKDMSDMEPIVRAYTEYKKTKDNLASTEQMLAGGGLDADMEALCKDEISVLAEKLETDANRLRVLLLPKDPNDDKNVFLEIRAGTGGEEAGLFAADLLRMYMRYGERLGWKSELIDMNETGIGGVREAVVLIKGRGAYSRLKYESGVHRVQRVPETESSGRIHTSAATVAVLPEVDDVDVNIDPNDVRVDVYHSSGHGGQSVNTTDSAVRLTHIPTGIVVTCQDEKSQIKNKDKAFKVLRARIFDEKLREHNREISEARKSQVGTGDRSERIRTYNFPQGRVSDHRINLTLYKLDYFLDGDLDEVIDGLVTNERAEKLKNI